MSLEKLTEIVTSDLRDEFAKAALTGMLADPNVTVCEKTAATAYNMAEMMLVERAKRLKPKEAQ